MTHPKKQHEPVLPDAELRRKRATAANAALWHPATEGQVDFGISNWSWPLDVSRYDRRPSLTAAESAFLDRYFDAYAQNSHAKTLSFDGWIDRLITPIEDVFQYIRVRPACRPWALNYILRETARRERTIWGWSREEWIDTINRRSNDRQSIVAVAYLLCDFSDIHRLGGDRVIYIVFARKLFGTTYVVNLLNRTRDCLTEWGYLYRGTRNHVCRLLCQALIQN